MTTPGQVLAADGELDLDAVVAALARGFRVATGARERVARTGLDTFDHRLRAAGLVLEQVTDRRATRFVLRSSDGAPVASAGADQARTWPGFADALPDGPLRATVAAACGIRALIAAPTRHARVRRLQLRNGDDKLVVRVLVEEPTGPDGSPAWVTVEPLRGYDADGRRVRRLLAGAGLRPAEPVPEPGAPEPAAATDRSDRSAPAAALLADELGDFHLAMQENLPGLLDDIDTEFLHDFRVAVRRTRATLKLGRSALPPELRSRWEPAFKWLGDLTTPVRDLDVYELELPQLSSWLVGADPADLAPFVAHLRRRRAAERRVLVRGLRSARYTRLSADWTETLERVGREAAEQVEGGDPVLRAGEVADRQIRRAVARVVDGGSAITAAAPAEDLHTLRKRCKELRYALEVFAPVIDEGSRRRAVADLKGLQDVLGRFQDSEVQRQALRGFAQEMMAAGAPAAAVLAMGELVGHLDAEQDRARGEFDRAFASFVRPASAARLRRLGGRS